MDASNFCRVTHSNPRALEDLKRRVEELQKKEIAVGFPKGTAQAYPDGTSVAEVAAKNIIGVGVPARDFMTYARNDIISTAGPILQAVAKACLRAKKVEQTDALLGTAGAAAAACVQGAITSLNNPPNSRETIARKGEGSTPLIDTGHMRASVSYVVRMLDEED